MAYKVVQRRDEAETAVGGEFEDHLFVIDESLGYLVNYLGRNFARALAAHLAPHGVSVAQWSVLMFLWAEDGLSLSELSQRVAIEDATMVRTIDRMERDGFLRRMRDRNDRRRVNIFLADRGSALRDTLVPCAIAANEAATQGLTEAERDQTMKLLRRIVTSLIRAQSRPEKD
ncbi:MAG: MarR family winged helix-turn-helix transcriptional regulator [Thermomicrobiales bacterium]